MSTAALIIDAPDSASTPEIPAYILDAAQVAGEWWANSDRDPRIKFQPAVIVKLLCSLRDGNHYEPACHLAGVSYRQFREWMNRADDDGPESPFGRVAAAVKLAEAEAEAETVRQVRAASRDARFWAAGMTFLERRHPDRWRRPSESVGVQVNVGVTVGVAATEDTRRALVPGVVIEQIANGNADRPALGIDLSPQPQIAPALSPAVQIPVSDANTEAKAPPSRGVSPPNVA